MGEECRVKSKFDYSDEEREQFKKLQRALRVVKRVSKQFPISYLEGFLEIALKQGLGTSEYAERLEESKGNGSRLLGTLGDRSRRTEIALNWIEQVDDPQDSRKTHYYISPKGNAVLKQIVREMEK
jgi:DNA-binding MarR family transcriptional regulator